MGLVRSWAKLDGVDTVFLTDDWGTQNALMISPDLWRKLFAPRYRKIFDEAHRAGLDVVRPTSRLRTSLPSSRPVTRREGVHGSETRRAP
ncbi:MAG: hypothetical protein ACUVYA_17310 [Planctomycetota bacterium]